MLFCLFISVYLRTILMYNNDAMKETKKITQVQETVIVNNETGEVSKTEKVTTMNVGREPDYIKLYIKDIAKLYDLPNSSTVLIFALLNRMSYNNEVVLISPVKRMISTETGLAIETINKRIGDLKAKNFIIAKERSVYLINPEIFAKGRWEDIKKIRLSVEYSKEGGRKMKTDFDTQQILEFPEEDE